ncbi:MAG: hypothetical protein AUH69_07865 [Actinobacteria bacterium 13_1_40CM_4_65_12]|nr:MAG: hypothetical protein AUH69_07865 [Actinobacteria bacterium 13_1_40CM_4_65_12]
MPLGAERQCLGDVDVVYLRPAEVLSLGARPRQPRSDSIDDQVALELRHAGQDVKEKAAAWRCRVELLI